MEQVLDFLNVELFKVGENYQFTLLNLVLSLVTLAASVFVLRKQNLLITQLGKLFEIGEDERRVIRRAFRIIVFWLTIIFVFKTAGVPLEKISDYPIYSFDCETVTNPDFNDALPISDTNPQTIEKCNYFRLSNILNSIVIFFIFRILVWIIIQLLRAYYKRRKMDIGSQYAINRLIKYFIYTVMVLAIIETLGFQLTVIWGAAGALLVGFGLGLQQTFNDLFSGILIMIEGSVHVGDMVRVKGEVGKITKIGIRASEVKMRDNVELIVPNSHLVMDGLANWNHSDHSARFSVAVGVAYGSDTTLVKNILLDIAKSHSKVMETTAPIVRFVNFGDSSLDFELHFWTYDVFGVLDIQSDLRFEIDSAFRANKVEIPFQQRDLWVRNPKDLK